jgi:hypothetical protein
MDGNSIMDGFTFVRNACNQKKIVTNKTQTKQEKHTENSIHLKLN